MQPPSPMNQHSVPSPRAPCSRIALLYPLVLLSLTGCGADNAPFGALGSIDGWYDGEWRHFSDVQKGGVTSPAEHTPSTISSIHVCGTDDDGTPNERTDDSLLCFILYVDTAFLGTGPTTLVIDGLADVRAGWIQYGSTFTPRPGHSPAVRAAWATTHCYGGSFHSSDVRLEVTGTVELRVNDATRVAGHLAMETEGETAGRCPARKARADVEFDFEPGPAP